MIKGKAKKVAVMKKGDAKEPGDIYEHNGTFMRITANGGVEEL